MARRAMNNHSSAKLHRLTPLAAGHSAQSIVDEARSQFQQDSQALDRMAGESPASFRYPIEDESRLVSSWHQDRKDGKTPQRHLEDGKTVRGCSEIVGNRFHSVSIAFALGFFTLGYLAYVALKRRSAA